MNHRYEGRDLEAMDGAVNYHRWIVEWFQPYLGRRILEVGAGTGAVAEMLAVASSLEEVILVEPSRDMFRALERRVNEAHWKVKVRTFCGTFLEVRDQVGQPHPPDTALYVNVLEHIEDDLAELKSVGQVLALGGHLCVFAPALPALYGPFDRRIGHFRRYRKAELEEKCRDAGFDIVISRYMDFLGVLPWWLQYRLGRSDRLDRNAVAVYDRWVVPIGRWLESHWVPPIGKNLLVVAKKPTLVLAAPKSVSTP